MAGFITASPNETVLQVCITTASRIIDEYTGRVFYTTEAETRTFDASNQTKTILTDDLLTVTSVTLDETILTTDDYNIYPQNNTPKERIVLSSTGTDLVVVGDWGYSSAIPDQIQLACRFIAKRLYLTSVGQDNVKSERTMTYSVTYDLASQLTQTEELMLNSFKKYKSRQL